MKQKLLRLHLCFWFCSTRIFFEDIENRVVYPR